MNTVIFDLEAAKPIIGGAKNPLTPEEAALLEQGKAVVGWENAHKAGVASGVMLKRETGHVLLFDNTEQSLRRLAYELGKADIVIGYNHVSYDYPLLAYALGCDVAELTDTDASPGERDVDLLQMIWAGSNGQSGNSLGAVTENTLGVGKQGSGAEAPWLFINQRLAELYEYNVSDVLLTDELDRFIRNYGYVINGKQKIIRPVQPAEWAGNPFRVGQPTA